MTRRLSLTTAVAVAALSVGAPAALGKVHAQAEVAPNRTQPSSGIGTYGHARGLPGEPQHVTALRLSDSVDGAIFVRTGETAVSATSSGRETEWPQVGAGLGIGLLLALGLGLIVRVTHIRPFAH